MARVCEVDPSGVAGPTRVLAAMCWPGSDEHLEPSATFAAHMIGIADSLESELLADTKPTMLISERLRAHHGPLGDVLIDKWAQFTRPELLATVPGLRAQVNEQLYQPAGGLPRVVHARGLEAYLHEIVSAIHHGGASAGLILLLVARMHQHHRTAFSASQARAITIMEKMHQRHCGFGVGRILKVHWRKWAPVAPIWAGVMVAGGYPWGQTDLWIDKKRLTHGIFDGLTPSALDRAASYSSFFHEFGTTFIPLHSSTPLLDPVVSIRLQSRGNSYSPDLKRLNAQELAATMTHESK